MTTLAVELQPFAHDVRCSEDTLYVELVDGRTITVPTAWFPTLSNATESERNNWQLLGNGEGIHWPDIDEDLSVSGLLLGSH